MKILGCVCLLLGLWIIAGDFVDIPSERWPPRDMFWFVRPLKDGLPTLLFGVLFLILAGFKPRVDNMDKGDT